MAIWQQLTFGLVVGLSGYWFIDLVKHGLYGVVRFAPWLEQARPTSFHDIKFH